MPPKGYKSITVKEEIHKKAELLGQGEKSVSAVVSELVEKKKLPAGVSK